jgi:hypothetical protein
LNLPSYESIDPARPPADLTIRDTVLAETNGKPTKIRTNIEAGGKTGQVTRSYDPATGKLTMEEAFLDQIPEAQQWVDVGGQRMRLQQYLTLRQMRAFGIGFGGLRVVKMSTIQNIRALLELDVLLKQGVPPDTAVMQTHSVQYAQRTLAGAGEKVTSAQVVRGTGQTGRIGDLMEHYEGSNPSKIAENDRLLQKYGRTRDSAVLWNYDIELKIESAAASEAGPGRTSVVPIVPAPQGGED